MSRHILGDTACRRAFALLPRRARSHLARLLALPLVAVLAGALLSTMPAAPVQAACANPIVCENQLPGTPQSVWDVSDYSTTIQGFAGPFSVNIGNSINFKIESPASSYKVDIYRMGYYGGDGARLITSAGVDTPPLHAPQSSAVSGGNGVYLYGGSPAFPTDTYNATNYWVDVVFTEP